MNQPSLFRQAWYKWKSLRLPWRRKRLVGFDLKGHTYWEMANDLNSTRPRRLVQYPRETHYGDVHLSPAWLQWLRHTRPHVPTVEEQLADVQRQDAMKYLAARADERWNAKASLLDSPDQAQSKPQLRSGDGSSGGLADTSNSSQAESEQAPASEASQNPFDKAGRGPSEGWQPQTWQPGPASRK